MTVTKQSGAVRIAHHNSDTSRASAAPSPPKKTTHTHQKWINDEGLILERKRLHYNHEERNEDEHEEERKREGNSRTFRNK